MTKEQLAEQYAEGYVNYLYRDVLEHEKEIYAPDIHQTKADFKAGFNLAEELFKPKWISVNEQTPPKDTELLVKSPEGLIHLANWRNSYHVFTCQAKTESSDNWSWMQIPN